MLGDLGRSDSHAVVVGVYQVNVGVYPQKGVHDRDGILLVPIAGHACQQRAACGRESIDKSFVASFGRGGAFKPEYLYGFSTVTEQMDGIEGGRLAKLHIVDAYAGRVGVPVYIAVKNHHRHPLLIHLSYDRGERGGLIGGDDDDVKAVVGEVADVLYLLGVAVVGRAYLNHGILMEHDLAVYLVVHLRAPVILAALRHADFVYFALGAPEQGQQYCE